MSAMVQPLAGWLASDAVGGGGGLAVAGLVSALLALYKVYPMAD